MYLKIQNIQELEIKLSDDTKFIVVTSHDDKELFLIQKIAKHEKWLVRLIDLFKRFSSDEGLSPSTIDPSPI